MTIKSKLFALDDESIAAAVVETYSDKEYETNISISTPRKGRHTSIFCEMPTVLSNGFFFAKKEVKYSDGTQKNVWFIESILHDFSIATEVELDPSKAALLRNKNGICLIACVNRAGTKIHLFGLEKDSNYKFYNGNKYNLIYETYLNLFGRKINAIVGFPNLVHEWSGIGYLKALGSTIFFLDSFSSENRYKLLSTVTGYLLYDAIEQRMIIHNLTTKVKRVLKCTGDTLYNLSVSLDSKYLVALQDENNNQSESHTIHCYNLDKLTHHMLKLDEPIVDICIGKDDQICMLQKQNVGQSELTSELVRKFPGKMTDVLSGAISLSPQPVQPDNSDSSLDSDSGFDSASETDSEEERLFQLGEDEKNQIDGAKSPFAPKGSAIRSLSNHHLLDHCSLWSRLTRESRRMRHAIKKENNQEKELLRIKYYRDDGFNTI